VLSVSRRAAGSGVDICQGVQFFGSGCEPRDNTRDSLTVSLRRTPHWTMPKIKLKPADINDVVSYILSLRNPR